MNQWNNFTEAEDLFYFGNLIINGGEDFVEGEKENIILNNNNEIILEKSSLQGKYISPIMTTQGFNELVASWNVDTPMGSEIELLVRVKVQEQWSNWVTYGKWSENGNRESVNNQSDGMINMSIDTLEVLYGKDANAIIYMVELRRENINIPSPKVRNIFFALKLIDEIENAVALDKEYFMELNVPERSQMVVPEIGSVICSPTSLSMVLEYYGYYVDTVEVAENVLDKGANIYGNWSFNVAYGGTKVYSYVARFTSINDIKEKIVRGIPVIASIKSITEDSLIGAPQTYPSGHLLVVRGFKIKNGEEYIIVNDPAAKEVETVRREYKVSQFERVWSKMVYILEKK
ncbi:peptidase C39 family protein [Tissierella pigra]|uniref:Peptidase C39 family protein n=1 Tax=Tissierella pigra TaxID=2607614 RepID=A0A6N7Y1X7_9FIRM|nr:peptidase C39 family protein [Tissierella pigra]MSU02844.1 peptidase C39 family protein [Tissierella pigra]